MAFIRLREASRGLAASRWGLVSNVLKAFYAIPLSLGADHIWLRDAAEAEYVELVGAYLRGSGKVPPIGEVLQNAGVLSFPPWWASPEDSFARMRIHAESMGMETREILSAYDCELFRIRRSRTGVLDTSVERLSTGRLHCRPVPRVSRPTW